MKILFVMENFDLGGVEMITFRLMCGLQEKNARLELKVIAEENRGELASLFLDRFACDELGGRNRLFAFKTKADTFLPDLVIFTKGGLSKYLFVTPRAAKTVVIQHVPIVLPEIGKLKNIVRKFSAKFLYRWVNSVICVSDGIRDNLVEVLGVANEKAVRIYNPVIDEKVLNTQITGSEYDDYFVAVGRIHFQKGYDLLVEIVKQVKDRGYPIKVVIIGDGPDRELLRKKINDAFLQDNIILHGFSPVPCKYINNAKATLLTSRWEGLPTVLVESIYLQTPIIAFDCHYGPSELIDKGNFGSLIPFGDFEAFTQAIIESDDKEWGAPDDMGDFQLTEASEHYYRHFESLCS